MLELDASFGECCGNEACYTWLCMWCTIWILTYL